MRRFHFLLASVVVVCAAALPAAAQVASVEAAWSRPAIAGGVGLGAMTITGGAQPDRLLGASSPAARAVELHATVMDGALAHMHPLSSLEVPAGGRVVLGLGGPHLMLTGLVVPLRQGNHVPVVLRFERAGEVAVTLEVLSIRSRGPASP